MKTKSLRKFMKFSLVLVAAASMFFVSCKKDDPDVKPAVIEDGIYVKGGSTALTDFNVKGLMRVARNEVTQADRAQLMEIYIAVKGGEPGFNIVSVAGSAHTTYSPGTDFAVVTESERDVDEPQVDFWRGSYTEISTSENKAAFKVPTDGLYHVVIDTEIKKIVIAPVVWGVIGAATPGGWGSSTVLAPSAFDLNTITFEANDMTLTKADYKFRYSNGWKIILDPDFDLGLADKEGIKINTNLGGSIAALVPGGDNISNATPGKYTVKMVWNLGAAYSVSVTKTGDLNLINYTDTQLGLVGDGLIVNEAQHNWDETIMLSVPAVENETTYIWTYNNVEVTNAGSFKIREGQDWDHKSIGYGDVEMAGLSADKFETNADGNFIPTEDGTYDMVLKIDAVTETYTFTVNPAGVSTGLYMLGDGCSAGWDNATALPMDGADGLYTLTTTLNGEGTAIKFITTLGQWAPMYGTDGTATSTSGPLVYRATENDPDPANIPAPDAAGNYLVTVNTNDMTYSIAAAKK